MKSKFLSCLFSFGCYQQRRYKAFSCCGVLFLAAILFGWTRAVYQRDFVKLFVEEDSSLSSELSYTEQMLGDRYGSTYFFIMQTRRFSSHQKTNLLTADSLTQHLNALVNVTSIELNLFNRVWRLEDVCLKASYPHSKNRLAKHILDQLKSCIIASPLDCFWEGSKILGPRDPIMLPDFFGAEPITWRNFNPELFLNSVQTATNRELEFAADFFRKVNLTTGYQKKYCINPHDPHCPFESPNYRLNNGSQNLAYELSGGCFGYAPKYLHWDEKMILGGIVKTTSGTILSADAMQTVIHLAGEQDLYKRFETISEWTQDKAKILLKEFKKKMSDSLLDYNTLPSVTDSFSCFTPSFVDILLERFTHIPYLRIVIACILWMLQSSLTMVGTSNCDLYQSSIGIVGVLLVILSTAAGLGLCFFLGLPITGLTTQVVPFLAIGLGVNDMLCIYDMYARVSCDSRIKHEHKIGELLKLTGCCLVIKTICKSAGFFIAAFVPVPLLKAYSLQVATLILLNLFTMMVVFPALISYDLWMKKTIRVDLCRKKARRQEASVAKPENSLCALKAITGIKTVWQTCNWKQLLCNGYVSWIEKSCYKCLVFILSLLLFAIGIFSFYKLEYGSHAEEFVSDWNSVPLFLDSHSKYFGSYEFQIVTKSQFQYETLDNQLLYKKLYQDISKVHDDLTSQPLWLDVMTSWLREMQLTFDTANGNGYYHSEGWYENATEEAILSYRLLIQTGDADNPVDLTRVHNIRLVHDNNTINSDAFYNYLTAWLHTDHHIYEVLKPAILPTPKTWIFNPVDDQLEIPKAEAIKLSRMTFTLRNIHTNHQLITAVKDIRHKCDYFIQQGLPNYPSGLVFMFWDQFPQLKLYFFLSLIALLAVTYFVSSVMLWNHSAGFIVMVTLAFVSVEHFVFFKWIGIKMSSCLVVVFATSLGITIEFFISIIERYISASGKSSDKLKRSFELTILPILHGAVSILIGVINIRLSESEYIFKHFSSYMLSLFGTALLNGLVFVPVLLHMSGCMRHSQPQSTQSTGLTPYATDPYVLQTNKSKSIELLQAEKVFVDSDLNTCTHSQKQKPESGLAANVHQTTIF